MRDRVLAVYGDETPDRVPFIADAQHWYYHKNGLPFDIGEFSTRPDYSLLDFHKRSGIGFFSPSLISFFSVDYPEDVQVRLIRADRNRNIELTWVYTTPLGEIKRTRIWEEQSYSWAIKEWAVKNPHDLEILQYALAGRTFIPHWKRYNAINEYIGEDGVVYLPFGYSAMGFLLNQWMGIENTVYALHDEPVLMGKVIDSINANNLQGIDMLAESPAKIIMLGDNFSGDIQPPHFFDKWSASFYREAVKRLHQRGKYVAVHIDGRLKGALGMIQKTGADCGDSLTPLPMGDLTPQECRSEAGPDFILSGGIAPPLLHESVDREVLKKAVLGWLNLRKISPRLILSIGDEVPLNISEDKLQYIRDLVEEHGKYC